MKVIGARRRKVLARLESFSHMRDTTEAPSHYVLSLLSKVGFASITDSSSWITCLSVPTREG